MHSRDESSRVEHELDTELGVKVHEWGGDAGLVLEVVLSSDLGDHGESAIWKLDVLLVQLKVLLKSVLNVLVAENLAIDNVAEVLQDHVDLGHR